MAGTGSLDPASWDSRRTSFGSVAAGYAALRPGYPGTAVGFLLGDAPRRVVDVGAGTGLLTERLVAAGHDVLAVDPSAEMLEELAARLPGVQTHRASVEGLPLPTASVDAVVAGQAAHWFRPEAAAAEMRRVLRPGGVVGLVWNVRDERVPWVAALGELLADEARGHEADQTVVAAFARALAADVERTDVPHTQVVTPEQVVAGIGTRSYVATMDDATRAGFLDRIRQLLATHPDTRGRDRLELPHIASAYRLTPR